jgi:hypothetical protein
MQPSRESWEFSLRFERSRSSFPARRSRRASRLWKALLWVLGAVASGAIGWFLQHLLR